MPCLCGFAVTMRKTKLSRTDGRRGRGRRPTALRAGLPSKIRTSVMGVNMAKDGKYVVTLAISDRDIEANNRRKNERVADEKGRRERFV